MKLDFQKLTDFIEGQTDPEPFSGVVYLAKDETVLFEMEHGFAIKSESIPIKINTRFQMASGCKVFTSVAICQLVASGALRFDTPLRECVDVAFPHYSPDITLHHLLTHSSGITSYFEEDINPDYGALWQDLPVYRIKRPADFLPMFQAKPTKFSPGDRFDYNDGGYILLGLVIENVAGMDYPSFIRERVFKPAGMIDSGYFATDMLPERTAYSYIRNPDDSLRTNFFAVPIIGAPDGGAYTTAPDMRRFWKALRSHKLISADMLRTMLQAQIVTDQKPPGGHYGYGVWLDQRKDATKKVFVLGYDPGVAFYSTVYPETDIVLTVIGNTSEALWPLYKTIEAELGLQ